MIADHLTGIAKFEADLWKIRRRWKKAIAWAKIFENCERLMQSWRRLNERD
jgi:hypothetical protein